ncbi:MAG TPA: N-6 DNA methylase [Bacteroidales bacterium]|nr:N-6 DNA methylase [Bacteroidales bacterium]
MTLKELKPRKALNKAFLKVKPNRSEIELFKTHLITLLDRINDSESEEFHKNLISDFLKDTYYKQNHFINTKGRNDLVIHNGPNANSTVGVIIEAKKPTNKTEMVTTQNLNVKAFQELVLYYLRDRITDKNLEVKHLIVTNVNEWFIFDATTFDRLFAQNKKFVQQFTDFEAGRLADTTTDFFYKQIAEPFIESITSEIEFARFSFQDYQKVLRNPDKTDDILLIALFKLLSPEHLLKLPFANDSNTLDKKFYSELLHIIGLTETKKGSKKLIERNKKGERNSGTILEDTIIQLDSLDKLSRLEKPSLFGKTEEERLFNVALELSITWMNRILFLKLLEAQLITYNKGDQSHSFLNLNKIKSFDDLNALFFQVLARKHENRNQDVKKAFEKVPYLNSSLFEPTDLEHSMFLISNLSDDKLIPVFSQTVLKDEHGKKITGNLNTLEYLLAFLNAYDFGAEGGEEIQEENKTLINASVLGLIFEKINGYKDGSFFTPGFITMYMCRETIRKAVVQKFSQEFPDYKINRIEDIYDLIPQKISRKKANEVVNSLKICDPAVGSGHFLVSALNELIAIKNDLKILEDREGKSLHRYEVEVVNDELIVTDEEGELFEYNPNNKESQRVQETLFHEKQTIIENCLFGVDINPNSVKICRLRLWIELLKNAYYLKSSSPNLGEVSEGRRGQEPVNNSELRELETLPNIDINIKCGNSLVSSFAIDADLKQALKKSKWTINSYRMAVSTYRNAENKEQKREMERLINEIKDNFRVEITNNDPKKTRLSKLAYELYNRFTGSVLFEPDIPYGSNVEKRRKDEQCKIEDEIAKLQKEIDEIESNKIYENAFEWRFEFPEVLNNDGEFVGFDVVIGNPPYVDLKELDNDLVKFIFTHYNTSSNRVNLYSTFVEKAYSLLKPEGYFSFIIPNSILMGSSYQNLRNLIKKEIYGIVKLPEKVFEDAIVETVIIEFKKNSKFETCQTLVYKKDEKVIQLDPTLKQIVSKKSWEIYNEPKFNIYISDKIIKPLMKIHGKGKKLGEIADFTLGITPYDKYKGHSKELIENKEFHSDLKLSDEYKPLIKGENIVPYYVDETVNSYIKYGSWLGAPREERFFTEPRVIVRQIVSGKPPKIYAGYTDKPLYFTQIGFSIIPKSYITVFELTTLLNSKLMNFYHKYLFLDIEKELFQKILIENCKLFPCKSFKNSDLVKKIVEQIIEIKSTNAEADTTDLESQIDQLVYELYGLTEEEIQIVENS